MATRPIVDSHVHIWDTERFSIPWLEGIPGLNKRIWIDDYFSATGNLNVEGFVYLQVEVAPPYSLIEAQEIASLAETDPRVLAIVPWAPLEEGDKVRIFLDQLVKISPKIKSIRRIVQGEPDPEFCLQPGFIRGNQILPEYGLTSEICCYYQQLAANIELVRQCPGTEFILNHIAKPNIRGHAFEPWASQMTELASLGNVVCKISGATTEADPEHWTVDDVRPYVEHALIAFGEDKVLFGSDWPVVTQAASYTRWVETVEEITRDFSDEQKTKLWKANAVRFYRLEDEV
ncbi:MAG: amidohydrolase [Thermomicrobiales bacterium]|nr:MAG: amidohydrolase [Thermomicrobiales bacterium]